jgi:stage V sporulation protein AE
MILIFIKAFIVGGLICVVGQVLIDRTKLTPARILVLYVVCGVVLGAIGLFSPLEEFAGSGATVPLLGFGAALVNGTRQIIEQDGAIGILTGPLTSGAGGIMVAVLSGLIMSCITKPRAK